jgi:gluconolactonase
MMKWTQESGITVAKEDVNRANGMTRDRSGNLVACEHDSRRVVRFAGDGTYSVVADRYRGVRLNSPNDVVVKSDGSIFFTDPPFGLPGRDHDRDLDFNGVFKVDTNGTLDLLLDDMERPNGLAFSPDESTFYVNDSRKRHIRAFDVSPDGQIDLTSDRVFCRLDGERPGVPDGMKVDTEGNVYCGGSGGIWIIDSTGKHLGTIVHGERQTTNVAWGGHDSKTLFFTTINTLGRIRLEIAGVQVG